MDLKEKGSMQYLAKTNTRRADSAGGGAYVVTPAVFPRIHTFSLRMLKLSLFGDCLEKGTHLRLRAGHGKF